MFSKSKQRSSTTRSKLLLSTDTETIDMLLDSIESQLDSIIDTPPSHNNLHNHNQIQYDTEDSLVDIFDSFDSFITYPSSSKSLGPTLSTLASLRSLSHL